MNSLTAQELMQVILTGLLMFGGYMYILHVLADKVANQNAVPIQCLILLVFFGTAGTFLILTFLKAGNIGTLFLMMLFVMIAATGAVIFLYLRENLPYMNKGAMMLFAAYALAILFITLLGRQDVSISTILVTPFEDLREAVAMHSFAPVRHMFLNVVMFVPYGFLFAMMDPEELTFVSRVLPAGLFMSTMIESVQMLLNRGQADVDDIIANTLGAVIGMIGFRIFESFSDLREN